MDFQQLRPGGILFGARFVNASVYFDRQFA